MPDALSALDETQLAAARLPSTSEQVAGLSDDDLMEAQRRLAAIANRIHAAAALAAAEIARRSRRELGYAGLAQRTGARRPEQLVQQLTGATGREAAALVRVGAVMHDADEERAEHVVGDRTADSLSATATATASGAWSASGAPWLASVGAAVARGDLSLDAAEAIRTGIGVPTEAVTPESLRRAVDSLVADAASLDADRLHRRARTLRDELDVAGVDERQRLRYEAREARAYRRRDGMIHVNALLAPEAGGEYVLEAFERILSPRRGGPRFVDPAEIDRAARLVEDPRSNEQLLADALVELIRLGATVEPGRVVGSRKPAVRVLVTERALLAREGVGHLEGSPTPVSLPTVESEVCESGTVAIRFGDDGRALNLGRESRLFDSRQKAVLAARDGGCRFPDCERPPSWCEAHHIEHWQRDGGRTDIDDGVLLCRFHHLLVHNNHWRIRRHRGEYLLVPPRAVDPQQTPLPMPSKSAALRELLRTPQRA